MKMVFSQSKQISEGQNSMTIAKKIHKEPDLNLQREIMKGQEKVIAMYRKRLNPKFQKELQTFAQSGKQIGSSEFFKLSPLVREIMVKLSMVNLDILSNNTKNPIKKLQFWIARLATKKLSAVTPAKKKADPKAVPKKVPFAGIKKLFAKKS